MDVSNCPRVFAVFKDAVPQKAFSSACRLVEWEVSTLRWGSAMIMGIQASKSWKTKTWGGESQLTCLSLIQNLSTRTNKEKPTLTGSIATGWCSDVHFVRNWEGAELKMKMDQCLVWSSYNCVPKASKVAPAGYTPEVNLLADAVCIPDSQLRPGHRPWLAFLSNCQWNDSSGMY